MGGNGVSEHAQKQLSYGDNIKRSTDPAHEIFSPESVESIPDSQSLPLSQPVNDSVLESGNTPEPTLEKESLFPDSSPDRDIRDALLQLVLANQTSKVVERIGKGGQGESYLLVDGQGKKFKAKILDSVPTKALFCPADELPQYLPEARYLPKVAIPGIAKFIGAYCVDDSNCGRAVVVVSEYIEGETLRTRLSRLEPGRGLGVGETFNLLIKVSTTLAKLHSETHNGLGDQRLAHGDLKPDNIVLSVSDEPILIDFGSVRAITPGQTEHFTMGASHSRSITAGYTPLEQCTGMVIPASDIYALGITAYECLLGKKPKEIIIYRDTYQSFVVEPSATIPKPMAEILTKMVALHSDARYKNGQELLEALQHAQAAILESTVGDGEGAPASVDSTAQLDSSAQLDSTAQPEQHSGLEAAKKLIVLRTHTSNDPAEREKQREEIVAKVLSDDLMRDVVAAIISFSDERVARCSAERQAAIEHNAKLSWFGRLFFGKKVFDPADSNFAFSSEMERAFGTERPEARVAFDQAVKRLIGASLICHECWSDGYQVVGLRVRPTFKQAILNFLANQDKAD